MRAWLVLAAASAVVAASSASAQQMIAPSMPAAPAAPAVSATRVSGPVGSGPRWYGTVELRHHINTYYQPDGGYGHEEPSLHARLQVGAQMYDGMVDAYATLGVFKIPETQEVMQRQPELSLDLYPYRNQYFTLLQYNLLRMPVKSSATVTAPDDEEKEQATESTMLLFGVAPVARLPLDFEHARVELKTGVDGWTRLYSRRQYTTTTPVPMDDPDDDHFSLTDEGAPTTVGGGEPIEDYAMHYDLEGMTGFGVSPAFARGLLFEGTVHHHSRFEPRYYRDEADQSVSYDYAVERYSFYRIRLRYDLTDRLSIANDFYHFHDGFFAENRKGEDRRFRNVARVTCKL
jgi:hypothetical protein